MVAPIPFYNIKNKIEEEKDISRNDPCWCGSGKKYKKCGMTNSSEHQQNMAKK